MKATGTSIFNIRHSLFDIAFAFLFAFNCPVYSQGKNQTVGPDGCGSTKNNCHAGENKSMIDKHKNSVDDIADNEDARKYAELSGIGVANFLKGTSKCMDCHGTIISGKEAKDVEEGVSCESCHGAGSGYKDPHSEGPKGGAGIIRDGYTKSLPLGLKDLKNYSVRGVVCVRCHYLTDQKILAAGHPSGEKFNYKSGMKSVAKHWKYKQLGDEDQNLKYFADAKRARGPATAGAAPRIKKTPAPKPETADAAPAPKAETGVATPPAVKQKPVEQPAVAEEAATPPQQRVRKPPPPPRPPAVDVSASPPPSNEPIVLPPFPIITDSTRIDQTLLLLKRRLELLYKKTGS